MRALQPLLCSAVTLLCGLPTAGLPPAAAAPDPVRLSLKATDQGAVVDAGRVGSFTLAPPAIVDQANKESKPVEATAAGGTVRFRYADGAQATLAVQGDGALTVTFGGVPAGARSFRMEMLLPFTLAQGGQWGIGEGEQRPFPPNFEGKAFLYQGNAERLQFIDPQGQGLAFQVPAYSYQQLQDNRQWNWKIFAWFFLAPFQQGVSTYTVRVAPAGLAAPQRVVLADRFGQNPRMEWPGKVKSEAELRADVEADRAYYAGLAAPERDPYGGLPGSGKMLGLKRTGFFHVERKGERWFLVDPEGNAHFHLGICCSLTSCDDYTKTQGRDSLFEWLPSPGGEYQAAVRPNSGGDFSFYLANIIRKYGKYDREEWSRRMVERYRKWGFNSAGAFTGPTQASREMRFPYVSSLPLGEWDGRMRGFLLDRVRGIFDPFHPGVGEEIDRLFAERLPRAADDPLLIGYFLANEQAFEDIPRVIPSLVGDSPAKAELVRLLQEKYGTIERFNAAWNLKAESFDALKGTGLPVATRQASEDMLAYTERFLEAYYSLITRTYRKYDKNHLLIGNRWQPSTANSEVLCRVAGKHMDVISINYYTYGIDATYLRRLYQWSGQKPFFLSEFHYACPKESGLPGGINEVSTQRDRGMAYRNYLEQSAALGFVVGIEWFSALDQAVTGRFFDTENGNIGLVSVADRPYRDMLAEMKKSNDGIYEVVLGERPPFVFQDPRFRKGAGDSRKVAIAPRAAGAIKLDGTRAGWPGTPPLPIPGSRLVIGADPAGLEAAFRICYDDANLYLSVDVRDATPMQNRHAGGDIWNGDAVELFIGSENLEQAGPLQFGDRQILLSAGKPEKGAAHYYANAPKQYPCPLDVIPSPDGKGYTLQAAIPFEALAVKPAPGKELLFDLAVDDGPDGARRVCQLMWNGGAKNSSDRSYWGRLRLGD